MIDPEFLDFLDRVSKEWLLDLFEDSLDDWVAARKLGEFVVETSPKLLVGHLILCRALRHAGDAEGAIEQLRICRTIVSGEDFRERPFLADLEQEERILAAQF